MNRSKMENRPGTAPQSQIPPRLLVYLLTLAGFIALVVWVFSTRSWLFLAQGESLELPLHAEQQADYSPDLQLMSISRVELSLIGDFLRDLDLDPADLDARITQVSLNLKSPVPTVTPAGPGATLPTKAVSTPMGEPTTTRPPSDTPHPPGTATPLPSETVPTRTSASPSATAPQASATTRPPTSTAANTPVPPSHTPLAASSTPAAPTNTPSLTSTVIPSTNTPTFTSTALPPTHTPTFTSTAIPPTNTPIPPTATPPICSQVALYNAGLTGPRVFWEIDNGSGSDLTISSLQLSWPSPNDQLERVLLSWLMIWDGSASPPATTISSGWTGGGGRRTVPANSDRILTFRFDEDAAASGYNLTVMFTNGCSKSRSR